MKNRNSLMILTFVILLTISALSNNLELVLGQSNEVQSKLDAARASINQAFTSVMEAEAAGANINNLVSQMNDALGLLAQAENAFRQNDFDATSIKADGALLLAGQINTAAQNARESASSSRQSSFWLSIVFSIIGIVIFLVVLFQIWRWFKQRYTRNLLNLKPEVKNQ